MSRLRVEVAGDRAATALYVDELDPTERQLLLAEVGALLEQFGPDEVTELLAVLAQSTADQHAYRRECARRGVLGL